MGIRKTVAVIAACLCVLQACAPIEHTQTLAQPTGRQLTVPVGGTIASINKQKNLPNVFGASDIYGRKVDTGMIKIVYKGPAAGGGALVEQVDVDVHSNASVFTRSPGMATASVNTQVVGAANSNLAVVAGASQATGHSFTPHAETNIILPPNVAQFAVPPGKTLTLSTGEVIEFHPHLTQPTSSASGRDSRHLHSTVSRYFLISVAASCGDMMGPSG